MKKIESSNINRDRANILVKFLAYMLSSDIYLTYYDSILIDMYLNKIIMIYERNCDDYESCRFTSKRKDKQKREKI